MEAVFVMTSIAGQEGRNVATQDISGEFIKPVRDDDIFISKSRGNGGASLYDRAEAVSPLYYNWEANTVFCAELRRDFQLLLHPSLKFWDQVLYDSIGLGYVINLKIWCRAKNVRKDK